MKKILVLLITMMLMATGCSTETNEVTKEGQAIYDEMKNKDNIVGISHKDFKDVSKSKPEKVLEDKKGNFRKVRISESINMEEYARSYSKRNIKNKDEIHFILNFTNNTTTSITDMDGLIYVSVRERIEREEHSASKIGSGMILAEYIVYPDGDIEKL